MKKMQEEAIKEARATQAKCNVGTKEALKNIELNENKNSHKDNSPKKGYSLDFINKKQKLATLKQFVFHL